MVLGRLENLKGALKSTNFKFFEYDLLNIQQLEQVFNQYNFDIVYHLAANSDIQASNTSTKRDLNLTFMTTFNILECMKNNNVTKILFNYKKDKIYGESNIIYLNSGQNPKI